MTTTVSGGGGGTSTPLFKGIVAVFFNVVVPAGSLHTALDIGFIAHISTDVSTAVGQSAITINTPGWYLATVLLISGTAPDNGTLYHLNEGGLMDFLDGTPPEAYDEPTSAGHISMYSAGALLFNNTSKTYQMSLDNPGISDQTVEGQMILNYLGPGGSDS